MSDFNAKDYFSKKAESYKDTEGNWGCPLDVRTQFSQGGNTSSILVRATPSEARELMSGASSIK